METESFPLDWKIARVTSVHKKDPRNVLENDLNVNHLNTSHLETNKFVEVANVTK